MPETDDQPRYTPDQFSRLVNVPKRTLSTWNRCGKLAACLDADGKSRYYTDAHLSWCRENGLDRSDTYIRGFRTEVVLNDDQKMRFFQNLGVMRFVYNMFIDMSIARLKFGERRMSANEFSKWFNNEYVPANPDKPWIGEASSKALKQVMVRADQAWGKYRDNVAEFARKLKAGKKVRRDADGNPKWPKPPRFKKKHVDEPSYYFVNQSVHIERHRMQIPKIGKVRLKEYGYLPVDGDLVSGTLAIENGRFFVSVNVRLRKDSGLSRKKREKLANPKTDGVGADVGIKNTLILSDGTVFANINRTREIRRLEKKLARLDRSISRKRNSWNERQAAWEKESKNDPDPPMPTRNRLGRAYAERRSIYARLANIRDDHINKIVDALVRTKPAFIVLEDLNVCGLMANRHLAHSIARQKLHALKMKLIGKCREYGIEVRIVSKWYPSSKTCHECGHIKKDLKLGERTFICPECGYEEDRDINAAMNLRDAREYIVAA